MSKTLTTVIQPLIEADQDGPSGRLLPTDKMVRRCMTLLLERRWDVGHTHFVVAKEFGVTPAAGYAAYREALRFVRLLRDADANRAQILVRARDIAERDDPDRLAALTLVAKMTGTLDPPKEEIRTSEERVAYLRECLREPDDELLQALLAEREAVMNALAVPAEGESSDGTDVLRSHAGQGHQPGPARRG